MHWKSIALGAVAASVILAQIPEDVPVAGNVQVPVPIDAPDAEVSAPPDGVMTNNMSQIAETVTELVTQTETQMVMSSATSGIVESGQNNQSSSDQFTQSMGPVPSMETSMTDMTNMLGVSSASSMNFESNMAMTTKLPSPGTTSIASVTKNETYTTSVLVGSQQISDVSKAASAVSAGKSSQVVAGAVAATADAAGKSENYKNSAKSAADATNAGLAASTRTAAASQTTHSVKSSANRVPIVIPTSLILVGFISFFV